MPVNLLVLTEQSLAATVSDNEFLARSFKCHERMSTKGEMLTSSHYNTLLSLNDSLASLLHLSVDDIYAVRYALQDVTTNITKIDIDGATDTLNAIASAVQDYDLAAQQLDLEPQSLADVAFAQSLRFYTMDAQAPLDVSLLRANFAAVLFFFTTPLSRSSLIAPELLALLEALICDSAPEQHDRLPLLIFNLRFAPSDFVTYMQIRAANEAKAANIANATNVNDVKVTATEAGITCMSANTCFAQTSTDYAAFWGERNQVLHQVLRICGKAYSVGVGSRESFALVSQYSAYLWGHKSTPIPQLYFMPQALLSCQYTERVQSFLRTMRLFSQLVSHSVVQEEKIASDCANFSHNALLKLSLRAPFPIVNQPQTQVKVDALGRSFVLPVWQQQRLLSLSLPSARFSCGGAASDSNGIASGLTIAVDAAGTIASVSDAPLTIAFASRYLRYHPLLGLSPVAVCILSAIYKTFPRANIVLFLTENWYSWIDTISDGEAILEQNAALRMSGAALNCSPQHNKGYVALSDALVQQINKHWSRQHVMLQWLSQAGSSLASALGLTLAKTETIASASTPVIALDDLAASLTIGSTTQITPLRTYGQRFVQELQKIEGGPDGGSTYALSSAARCKGSTRSDYDIDDDLDLGLNLNTDLCTERLFASSDMEWQNKIHTLVQACYVCFDFAQKPPIALDLMISDQENFLLAGSQLGIACLGLQDDIKDAAWQEISLAYFKAVQAWDFGGDLTEELATRMEFWYEHMRKHNSTLLHADAYINNKPKSQASVALDANISVTTASTDFSASTTLSSSESKVSKGREDLGKISGDLSGFFVSVPLSNMVQQTDLSLALDAQIPMWRSERIQSHLQALYNFSLYPRQLLRQAFKANMGANKSLQAKICDVFCNELNASKQATKATGLNTQVQLSTYTYAHRYDLQWLFLRFFAAFASPNVGTVESTLIQGAVETEEPRISLSLGSVVEMQLKALHSLDHVKQKTAIVGADASAMLSFGCARGDELGDLCHYFPDYFGVGVDINPHALARARERYAFLVSQGYMAAERCNFVLSADLAQLLSSWQGPQSFSLVTAMTVLCRHPETVGLSNAHNLYPFATFKQQIEELCSYVAPHGLLCVHNANYCIEDSNCSLIQNLAPLFPFPEILDLRVIVKSAEQAVKVTVDGHEYNVSLDMSATDYWCYFLAQVQHGYALMRSLLAESDAAGTNAENATSESLVLYLPEFLLQLYMVASKSDKWGYTACFNAQEKPMPRIGATMFYRKQ